MMADYHDVQVAAWKFWKFVIVVLLILFCLGLPLGLWGCPTYNVWRRARVGESQLRQAEWNRKITIEEAEAKKHAAVALAEAEVARAKGVAEANKIIGDSLRENEAYLRYLWIQGLQDGSSEVIYVPTEANLPILEAVRKLRPDVP
jgi:hypothetical protein